MIPFSIKWASLAGIFIFSVVATGQTSLSRDWEVIEWRVEPGQRGYFYRVAIKGEEERLVSADARRRVPSMNQEFFPEPESGCGPTAVLNWILWMEKEGKLGGPKEGIPEAVHAQWVFREIDYEIRRLRQAVGAPRGGSNVIEIATALDRLVQRRSGGELRMAVQRFKSPLKIAELLQFTRGSRIGILIGHTVEQGVEREIGGYHAVSLVAADRRGGLMVNNWGKKIYGSLRTYPDGQFYFPRDASQEGMRVEEAVCFVPVKVERAQERP